MLNEDHLAISDMCKNFASNELAPTAAMHDKTHTFPAAQVKQMGALGLMGMTVSEDYGGKISRLS
jgi:alkylation response protein AidB-like acyl-CoA dehydrogenase